MKAHSMGDIPLDSLYIVDINNDGADEYVAMGSSGKSNNLVLTILGKTAGGFSSTKNIPKLIDDLSEGPYRPAIDPSDGKEALFVRTCQKVYINLAQDEPFPTEVAYLWQGGSASSACDANWVAYRRSIFRKLYERGSYARGELVLRNLVAGCGEQIGPKELAWTYNDLALTQLKFGKPARCLDYVHKAEKEKDSVAGDQSLQNAVAHNESLCTTAMAVAPHNSEAGWLLDPKLSDTDQVVADPRFDNLLAAIIPDLSGHPDLLRDKVSFALSHEPSESKVMGADRSVTLEVLDGATYESKAMAWIDPPTGVGIVALYEPSGDKDTNAEFTLGSRNVSFKDVPKGFRDAFQHWKTKVFSGIGYAGQRTVFVGAEGNVVEISTPK
jgi:hypothetical protein